jgi:hypothetical protein
MSHSHDQAVKEAPSPQTAIRFLDLPERACAFIAENPDIVSIFELTCCGAPVTGPQSRLGARYCRRHRLILLRPAPPLEHLP